MNLTLLHGGTTLMWTFAFSAQHYADSKGEQNAPCISLVANPSPSVMRRLALNLHAIPSGHILSPSSENASGKIHRKFCHIFLFIKILIVEENNTQKSSSPPFSLADKGPLFAACMHPVKRSTPP